VKAGVQTPAPRVNVRDKQLRFDWKPKIISQKYLLSLIFTSNYPKNG
jgi:hypothetical protein